eukprot:5215025-Amphidinium_carterae.1
MIVGQTGVGGGHVKTHSLKVTLLSWLAKFACPHDDQSLLGYHVLRDRRSALTYSRDALAGPLRFLDK